MATKVKLVADGVVTADQLTLTTASTGTNTTAPATTAFVQQEVAALVDSSPDALNTLNELAAALGDDANFSTTVTNSIATKLPLAGGTLTGALTVSATTATINITGGSSGASLINFGDSDDGNVGRIYYDHTDNFMQFKAGDAERMRIDSSGNVGIGATPKAYHSDYKAIDINNSASVMGYTGNNGAWLMENLYFGTDNNWKHKNSDFSALVEMYDGVFNFYNTASGTAGATATLQNRLKIDQSGNVGIGNSTPSNNHANANRLVVGNGTAGGIANYVGVGTGWYAFSRDNANNTDAYDGGISYNGDRDLKFHTNAGSTRMTIDGAGNVGIGTSSPSSKLETVGGDGITISNSGDTFLQLKTTGTTATNYIEFKDSGGSAGSISYNHTDNYLATKVNGAERMRIDSSGNVKINNTRTTAVPLQVVGGTASGTMYDAAVFAGGQNSTSGSGAKIYLSGCENDPIARGTIIEGQMTDNGNSHALIFHTSGNSQTPTERMRIDAAGHLILGSNLSTVESGKLSVYTDATNDSAIYGYRSTSYFRIVPFLSNGAHSGLSNVNDSGLFFSDNFVIAKNVGGYYGMIVAGNGNIHIGTESEASGSTGGATFSADSSNRRNLILASTSTGNLELVEFRNPNGTVGTIKTNGTSTSYNTSSDYRLKENIDYDFTALNRVTQLKPARFNFITDEDTILDGFLAHEVSSIVPEAVSGEKDATKEEEYEITPAQYEDDGETLISEAVMGTRTVPVYQGIDQSKLVPLLTKAIQELKTELDAAKARLDEAGL